MAFFSSSVPGVRVGQGVRYVEVGGLRTAYVAVQLV